MGEQGKLGVYLNHCPNCGAYFQCEVCPICKTPFPKNLKPEKVVPEVRTEPRREMKRRNGGKVVVSLFIWFLVIAALVLFMAYTFWTTEMVKNGNGAKTETTAAPVVTVPFPNDGSINAYWGDEDLIKFTIINEKPKALFVRFKNEDVCVFEVYLSANGTASYQVPAGTYSVSMAEGEAEDWQGDERHFGYRTTYSRARSLFLPENTNYTLTIQNTKSENGDLKPSSKNEFNQ